MTRRTLLSLIPGAAVAKPAQQSAVFCPAENWAGDDVDVILNGLYLCEGRDYKYCGYGVVMLHARPFVGDQIQVLVNGKDGWYWHESSPYYHQAPIFRPPSAPAPTVERS